MDVGVIKVTRSYINLLFYKDWGQVQGQHEAWKLKEFLFFLSLFWFSTKERVTACALLHALTNMPSNTWIGTDQNKATNIIHGHVYYNQIPVTPPCLLYMYITQTPSHSSFKTTYISKSTKYFDILLLLTCEEVLHAPLLSKFELKIPPS